MRKCESCGKLYQESKDVFCPRCGAVAQKQCTHGSSFDSERYDRGEVYKKSNPDYQNTTYNHNAEPHAQRGKTLYNKSENTYETPGGSSDKAPSFNFPDLTKMLSKGKNTTNPAKYVGIIVFVIIIAFNFITKLLSYSDDADIYSDYEVVDNSGPYFSIIDEATIEMVNEEGDFKTFTLEIGGMGFDDYFPENMKKDVLSGAMVKKMLSENTFVDLMICDFSKAIVTEESYDNAISDCYNYPGEQIDGKCKYEFTYSFDYDEIVHIVNGVSFYLDNGKHINAELPFSAFSLSEDGEITYYTSYADSETAWNTVFSECSNEQEINRALFVDFDAVEIVEGESDYGE